MKSSMCIQGDINPNITLGAYLLMCSHMNTPKVQGPCLREKLIPNNDEKKTRCNKMMLMLDTKENRQSPSTRVPPFSLQTSLCLQGKQKFRFPSPRGAEDFPMTDKPPSLTIEIVLVHFESFRNIVALPNHRRNKCIWLVKLKGYIVYPLTTTDHSRKPLLSKP